MSSDLLQEFGNAEKSVWDDTPSHLQEHLSNADDDDNDFGDFEEPEVDTLTIESHPKEKHPNGIASSGTAAKSTGLIKHTKSTDHDRSERTESASLPVFFDADEAIADASQASYQHQASTQRSSAEQPLEVSLGSNPLQKSSKGEINPENDEDPAQFDFDNDENWEPVSTSQVPMTPTHVSQSSDVVSLPSPTSNEKELGPPPTNVPPPSVLLPLVAKMFQTLPARATVPLASGASAITFANVPKQPDQELITALACARAGAHVIAGRKLRWKCDALLSQSMKIGPAVKSGGMKLTGIDKTESRREDQEAAEAISVWRKLVGPLRSAVSKANVQIAGKGMNVPEIGESMPIRIVKPSEGAVSAPKCCFLCGIRREERVAKVDVDVEDSFGEFWTQHWGHVDCVTFWENYKTSLKQR